MSNEKFGVITTDNFGGFTWNENSRLNRITKWNNDSVLDFPSEILYLVDKDKNRYWSVCSRVANNSEYVVRYGLGYSEYFQVCDDILQKATVFVENDSSRKNIILELKNLNNEKRDLKLFYYVDFTMGEDNKKTDSNIIFNINKDDGFVDIKNIFKNQFDKVIRVKSSLDFENVYTDKSSFFRNDSKLFSFLDEEERDIRANNRKYVKGSSLIFEYDISLDNFENKSIVFSIFEKTENGEKIENIDEVIKKLEDVKGYWIRKLSKLQIETPYEELNIFINNWCMYQTISSRLMAKSAFYQSGGAIGFRDQLQDVLGLKFIDIDYMRSHILKAAAHQFTEGDVLHWWHEKNGLGVRTRFSDDPLWLVYAILEYIDYSSSIEILDEKVPYVLGENLKNGEMESCKIFNNFGREESLFDHCIRAIEKSINLGENNLPKIEGGDWNDGFNNIGSRDRGESIWLRILFI